MDQRVTVSLQDDSRKRFLPLVEEIHIGVVDKMFDELSDREKDAVVDYRRLAYSFRLPIISSYIFLDGLVTPFFQLFIAHSPMPVLL